jgi:hypothetical protein
LAKDLTWSDDGMSTTDGKYQIGVVAGLDGQPVEFYWERCPRFKVKETRRTVRHPDFEPHPGDELDERTKAMADHTVVDVEVVSDERPHPCGSLDEMHEQAAAMNRSAKALMDFEAPRKAQRQAAAARRRQTASDAELDALVARLLARSDLAEGLAARLARGER